MFLTTGTGRLTTSLVVRPSVLGAVFALGFTLLVWNAELHLAF